MSSSKAKPIIHAPPLIFPPSNTHKTTLIFLHGRGSTAEKFAEPLLHHPVSPLKGVQSENDPSTVGTLPTFRSHFPETRFVFPIAPLRRAIVYNRSLTHQWFDNWSLTEPEPTKQHLQIKGLRETTAFLHDLLNQEIELVGRENVVLMGLSQGCAASLVAAILWKGEPFCGLVGMCGYLPFRKEMQDFLETNEEEQDDCGFDFVEDIGDYNRPESSLEEKDSSLERAAVWLGDELQSSNENRDTKMAHPLSSIPIFMGHGTKDEKVPCEMGRGAASFLESLDVDVTWKEYEELGHWYSEDMLRDVVSFLRTLKDRKLVPPMNK